MILINILKDSQEKERKNKKYEGIKNENINESRTRISRNEQEYKRIQEY